jgi:surface antigen
MRIRTAQSVVAVFAAAAMAAFAASAQDQAKRQPGPMRHSTSSLDLPLPTLAELKAGLDESDRLAVLEAIHLGLSEVGDGQTYMWRRKTGKILGFVRPTRSTRDANGRVCRHLVFSLKLGPYSRTIEGLACRQPDKSWVLES